MSIEEAVIEKLRLLPDDLKRSVLEYVETLECNHPVQTTRRNWMGCMADAGVHITREDIDEARKEMWGSFPRDDIGSFDPQ